MYLPYPQLHAGNKCHVPLRVHSQCEGPGECVEREGVTMLPSLPTERLVEWRVGIAEGQSQPSASTAPTHDMVRMYCMCTCTLFAPYHHLSLRPYIRMHCMFLYLMKTVVVEMLYYCNSLCYMKCSTSLLTCITLCWMKPNIYIHKSFMHSLCAHPMFRMRERPRMPHRGSVQLQLKGRRGISQLRVRVDHLPLLQRGVAESPLETSRSRLLLTSAR